MSFGSSEAQPNYEELQGVRAPLIRWIFAIPAPAFTAAFRRPADDREESLKSTLSGLTAEQSRLCFTTAPAACKP
jgi:hypothetical protein